MNIRSLVHTPIAEITAAFNEAFSDYFIPLQFTEQTLLAKMKSEGIRLPYSVGAFEEEKLVGYILHGYEVINGVKTIYNAGTGVIPAYRGRGITQQLYAFAISLLNKQGIRSHILEVIDTNEPAIHVYEKIGFTKVRNLVAYKTGEPILSDKDLIIESLDSIPAEVASFAGITAAWQNSLASIERDREGHQLIGVFEDSQLIGFAAFVAATGRVKQCVVHPEHRRNGIGRRLFAHMWQNSETKQLSVINVDEACEPVNHFLKALQFQPFLGLYEMKMELDVKD